MNLDEINPELEPDDLKAALLYAQSPRFPYPESPGSHTPYEWKTFCQRLEAKGCEAVISGSVIVRDFIYWLQEEGGLG